jgi:hypothetical protein
MFKKILATGFAVASLSVGAISAASAAVIDLGFAIDESGSVSGSATTGELGLVRQGLAAALDQIPSVGATGNPNTYRVSIIQFSSGANVLVSTTEITDASRTAIQNTLVTASRRGGGTNIGAAIDSLTAELCAGGSCGADTTIFNVATDGGGPLGTAPADAAAAGVDGLSYEAIGSGATTAPLLASAFPGTPVLVTDAANLPNPLQDSFVLSVATFADFEAAIAAKIGRVVTDTGGGGGGGGGTNPIPLPAGMPLLLGALFALGLARRKAA